MTHSFIRRLVIAGAIFGYTAGYSSIYFFHLAALLWGIASVAKLLNRETIPAKTARTLGPLGILWLYTFSSSVWSPDLFTWLRFQFYLACGLIALLAVFHSARDEIELDSVIKFLSVLVLSNLGVGFLESLGVFRLPMSPYSEYSKYFGTSSDLSQFGDYALSVIHGKPTGFNGNPNNFGFIAILALPFFIFHKQFFTRAIGLFTIGWLLTSVGSRGLFLAALTTLATLPLFLRHKHYAIILSVIFVAIVPTLVFTSEILQIESYGLSRMLTTFASLSEGIELIQSGSTAGQTSTEVRSALYIFTLNAFFETPILGLGFGGTEALLAKTDISIKNVHFFFLQLLADLGLVGFFYLGSLYFFLILRLRRVSLYGRSEKLRYWARSAGSGLIAAIPGSLAPSSLHYMLSFYVFIGLCIAISQIADRHEFLCE